MSPVAIKTKSDVYSPYCLFQPRGFFSGILMANFYSRSHWKLTINYPKKVMFPILIIKTHMIADDSLYFILLDRSENTFKTLNLVACSHLPLPCLALVILNILHSFQMCIVWNTLFSHLLLDHTWDKMSDLVISKISISHKVTTAKALLMHFWKIWLITFSFGLLVAFSVSHRNYW